MKKSLIIALALMLVLAFASSAMAAQVLVGESYLSTTATAYTLPGAGTIGSNVYRVYAASKFTADGKTNYPFEIYLPNEISPASYRIHSSYAKNTDACASCHSTHTAVGASLLQWYTVYETCIACHDGTVTTTYDVVNGSFGASGIAEGGAFGRGQSSSMHNVTGAMDIAAAPGGSTVATSTKDGNALNWEIEFGCESCHTPHGLGGNARILHPDANNVATDRAKDSGYSSTGIAAVTTDNINFTAGNALDEATAANQVYNAYYFLNGYPYSVYININGTDYGKGYAPKNFKVDNSNGYTVVTLTGATEIAAAAANPGTVKIVGTPSLKVTMDIKRYLQNDETVEHVAGMNPFCGACHTDYNTASVSAETYNAAKGTFNGSGEKLTGVYSKAHRHQVGFQWHAGTAGLKFETGQLGAGNTKWGMECLTCHVAHGVNESYWAKTLTAATKPWASITPTPSLKELAGSSALKRMPNMGTCEACHLKGEGNLGYAANTGQRPNPLDSTPAISDLGQDGAQFVGSAKCEPCHAETYAKYQKTAHSNMTDIIEGNTAEQNKWLAFLATLPEYTVSGDTVTMEDGATFNKSEFVLSVSWDHNTLAAVSTAAYNSGTLGLTTGNLYLLYEAGPFTEPEHYTCITCHNTPKGGVTTNPTLGANPNWADFKAKIAARTMETGIQCETSGCHGPGSKHVTSPSAKNIKNPGTFAIKAQSEGGSCGECHGSAKHQGEFWKAIAPTSNMITGTNAASVTGPNPMYIAQVASCITCHDPHANETEDISRLGKAKVEMQVKMPVRALCNSCHENRLVTKADFDKYLPFKADGMPVHSMTGQGYVGQSAADITAAEALDRNTLGTDWRNR